MFVDLWWRNVGEFLLGNTRLEESVGEAKSRSHIQKLKQCDAV